MLLKLPYNRNQTQFTTDILYRGSSVRENEKNKKIKNIIFEILSIAFILTTIFYFIISYNKSKEEVTSIKEEQIDLKNKETLTLKEDLKVLNQELNEINDLRREFTFPRVKNYLELN
jgi:PAS domain-containing protein